MKKQELTRNESRGMAAGLLGVGIASVLLTNDATAFVLLAMLAAVLLVGEKPGALRKLYRWGLRTARAVVAWADRHSWVANTVGLMLWIIFCLQMFVGCMDYICSE